MVDRRDDPPSNSGDDPQTPRQNERPASAQPSSRGEFRTLGMKLLGSARQHIRRYSAAANQPVPPLPSSWRSGTSEPLVWSGNDNSTAGQAAPPPVESVEDYLARQATSQPVPPAANLAEVQRQAESTIANEAAAPPVSVPPAPLSLAQRQYQQLLKIREIHEGRLAREAEESGESNPPDGTLFSAEAINERLGRNSPKPKTGTQRNISDNSEPSVARTPRRRGAIIEVTPPIKQPFEDMEWESNSVGDDFTERNADPASTPSAESSSFSDTNTPPVQRQASTAPSPTESEKSTESSPNAVEANSSPLVDEVLSVQRQVSSAPSPIESEASAVSSPIRVGESRTSFGDSPPIQRQANAVPSSTEFELNTAPLDSGETPPSLAQVADSQPTPLMGTSGDQIAREAVEPGDIPAVSRAVANQSSPLERFSSPEAVSEKPIALVSSSPENIAPVTTSDTDVARKSTEDIAPDPFEGRAVFAFEAPAEPGMDSAARLTPTVSTVQRSTFEQGESGSGTRDRTSSSTPEINIQREIAPDSSDKRSTPVENTEAQNRSFGVVDAQASDVIEGQWSLSPSAEIQRHPVQDIPSVPPNDSTLERTSFTQAPSSFSNEQSSSTTDHVPTSSSPSLDVSQRQPQPIIRRDVSDAATPSTTVAAFETDSLQPVNDTSSAAATPYTTLTADNEALSVQSQTPAAEFVSLQIQRQATPISSDAPTERSEISQVSNENAASQSLLQRETAPQAGSLTPEMSRQSALNISDSVQRAELEDQPSTIDHNMLTPAARRPDAGVADTAKPVDDRRSVPSDPQSQVQREIAPDTVRRASDAMLPNSSLDSPAETVSNRLSSPLIEPTSSTEPQIVQRVAAGETIPDLSSSAVLPISPHITPPSNFESVARETATEASVASTEAQDVQRIAATEPIADVLSSSVSRIPSQSNIEASARSPFTEVAATPAEVQVIQRVVASEPIPDTSNSSVLPVSSQLIPQSNIETAPRNTVTAASVTPAEAQVIQRVAASEPILDASSSPVSFALPQTPPQSNIDAAERSVLIEPTTTSVETQTVQRVAATELNRDTSTPFAQPTLPDILHVEESSSPSQTAQISSINSLPVIDQPPVSDNLLPLQRAVTNKAVQENLSSNSFPAVQRSSSESGRDTVNSQTIAAQSPASDNLPTVQMQRAATSEAVPEVPQANPLSAIQRSPSEIGRDTVNLPTLITQPPASVNSPPIQRAAIIEAIPEDVPTNSQFTVSQFQSESGREVNVPSSILPVSAQSPASVNLPTIQRAAIIEAIPEDLPTNSQSTVSRFQSESGREVNAPSSPLSVVTQPPTSDNPPTVQRAATSETISENTPANSSPAALQSPSESGRDTINLPPIGAQPPALVNPPRLQRTPTSETVAEVIQADSFPAAQRSSSENGRDMATPPTVAAQPPALVNPPTLQRTATSQVVAEVTQADPFPVVQRSSSESGRDTATPPTIAAQPPASVNLPTIQRASANETVSSKSPLERGESFQNLPVNRSVPLSEETAVSSTKPAMDTTPIQRVVQVVTDSAEGTAPSILQPAPQKETPPAAIQRQTTIVSERLIDTAVPNQPSAQPEDTFESTSLLQRETNASPETVPAESLPQQNEMNVFEALLSAGAVKPITASENTVRRQSDINRVSEPSSTPQTAAVASSGDFEQTVYASDSPEADLLRLLDLSPDTPVVRRKQSAVPSSDAFTPENTPETGAIEAESGNFPDQMLPSLNTVLNLQRSANRSSQASQSQQVSASESPRSQPLIQREMEQMSPIQQPSANVRDAFDDLDIDENEGVNLEELSRQVYHIVQQRLRVERERRGRL